MSRDERKDRIFTRVHHPVAYGISQQTRLLLPLTLRRPRTAGTGYLLVLTAHMEHFRSRR